MELSPLQIEWSQQREEAAQEAFNNISIQKSVVLATLLGDTKDPGSTQNLATLFDKYFYKNVDPVYTKDDINELLKHFPDFNNLKALKLKVHKGNYIFNNKWKKNFILSYIGNKHQAIIGASSTNRAVWFVFTNEKVDVNNGSIFVRRSAISGLKLMSTFEINPFSQGNKIVTDTDTGNAENKQTLTYNPGWLASTLSNMEKHVFKPLV